MALARPRPGGWTLSVEPVGPVDTLFSRLLLAAKGGPVALGVDFPIGLPRAYAALHRGHALDFLEFLSRLQSNPGFFDVAETLEQICPARPFYPRRGLRGMTRLSHALALGLDDASCLSRACDRATALRPAGAPVFWTLGANQSGKAALAAWRDMLLPALAAGTALGMWPFQGPFKSLLRPGRVAVAETYPAEALRQLGLRLAGSKRRRADRMALAPGLEAVMATLGISADARLGALMLDGFGADPAGEDRLDCVLGVLCVVQVLAGGRPDTAPADPWIRQWEGWVLGQAHTIGHGE